MMELICFFCYMENVSAELTTLSAQSVQASHE